MLFSGLVSCSIATGVPPALAVGPNSPTDVSSESIVLNAVVNPQGDETQVTFKISKDADLSNFTEHLAEQSPVSGSSSTVVSTTITALDSKTMYYYRVVATSVSGVAESAIMTVETV